MKKKEISDKENKKINKVMEKTNQKGTHIKIIVKNDRENISKIKPITNEEIEQQLTAIVFGEIKDRFGFDVSVQDKIKALQNLAKIRGLDNSNLNINANVKTDKLESIAFALGLGENDDGKEDQENDK